MAAPESSAVGEELGRPGVGPEDGRERADEDHHRENQKHCHTIILQLAANFYSRLTSTRRAPGHGGRRSAGSPEPEAVATGGASGHGVRRRLAGSGLLGLPEDLGDLVDLRQQLVGDGLVERALGAACARELGRLVEELVELRVLLEVRGLEVVRPEHPQVVLDELGPLLLDEDRPGLEDRVVRRVVLLG